MSTKAFIAAVLWTLTTSGVEAADWSLNALVSETALYNNNPGLSLAAPAESVALLSNLSVNLGARGQTSSFGLSTNFSYPHYFGPDSSPNRLHFFARANLRKQTKLSSFKLSTSINRQSTTLVEELATPEEPDPTEDPEAEEPGPSDEPDTTDGLADAELVTVPATRFSRTLTGSADHTIDTRNSVSLTASMQQTSFTGGDPTLVGSHSRSVSGSWNHKLTKLTSIRGTLGHRRFEPDDPTKSASNIYSATAGIRSRLTKRLSLSATAGVTVVKPGTTTVAKSLGLNYRNKSTTISFSASQDTVPTSLGEVQSNTALALKLGRAINDASRLALSVKYSAFSSSTGSRSLLAVSPSYSRQLGRNTQAQLSYTFKRRGDSLGTATSSSIVMKLTRNMVIIP